MVAVGWAPSASMRSYTLSACSGCPLRLQALIMVLYVRTSGFVPCAAATDTTLNSQNFEHARALLRSVLYHMVTG